VPLYVFPLRETILDLARDWMVRALKPTEYVAVIHRWSLSSKHPHRV
jgi:hypothetical protein